MADYDLYSQHFPAGMKVNVGIPVPGGNIFHDWAIIHHIDEDLLELQLSRDTLPDGVKLSLGAILDVRGGKEDSGYSCRAIIVSEGYQRTVLLRLIGEIVSDELREFYRIDAFLPIKYFLTSEASEVTLKKAWIVKREARIEVEKERKLHEKKPWQRLRLPQQEETPEEELTGEMLGEDSGEGENDETADSEDHSWDDVIPLAANISGGGIRILLHHQFKMDDLMALEIFLPSEPHARIIDAVGKVVFVGQNYAATKQMHRESFNTGIQFLYIDERDRDAIVSYISNVQLKRIRMLREKYLGRGLASEEEPPPVSEGERLKTTLLRVLLATIVIVILTMIAIYFKNYSENRPKNEIELIFEKGFMDYLRKIGRAPAQ